MNPIDTITAIIPVLLRDNNKTTNEARSKTMSKTPLNFPILFVIILGIAYPDTIAIKEDTTIPNELGLKNIPW